jgi:hypothetical protein
MARCCCKADTKEDTTARRVVCLDAPFLLGETDVTGSGGKDSRVWGGFQYAF